MSLKALAEQRLAALDEQRHPGQRWAFAPVPPSLAGEHRVEHLDHGRACTTRRRQMAALTALLAGDEVPSHLDDLRAGRRLIEIGPGPTRDRVLLASDNATVDPSERRVVYHLSELREVHNLPRAVLGELHQMKRTFGGSLEAN